MTKTRTYPQWMQVAEFEDPQQAQALEGAVPVEVDAQHILKLATATAARVQRKREMRQLRRGSVPTATDAPKRHTNVWLAFVGRTLCVYGGLVVVDRVFIHFNYTPSTPFRIFSYVLVGVMVAVAVMDVSRWFSYGVPLFLPLRERPTSATTNPIICMGRVIQMDPSTNTMDIVPIHPMSLGLPWPSDSDEALMIIAFDMKNDTTYQYKHWVVEYYNNRGERVACVVSRENFRL